MKNLKLIRLRKQKGASLMEYGILVALIAVVCIGAVGALGTQLNTMFEGIDLTP